MCTCPTCGRNSLQWVQLTCWSQCAGSVTNLHRSVSAMRNRNRTSLYWRLLPSYLLVIAVAGISTFLASEAVAPYFLDRHTDAMVASLHFHTDEPLEALDQDLASGFRRALTQSLVWALAASAVTAGVVGLFVTRRIVRPLTAMTRVSPRIAGGRYRQHLNPDATVAVGVL